MFKEKFRRWLEKLAKTNAQEFGQGQGLECCNLNKEAVPKKHKLASTPQNHSSAH